MSILAKQFLCFLSSAFISYLLIIVSLPFFCRFLLDYPNSRSSHHMPTPRGGGVFFVILTVFSCLLALLVPPSSSTTLFPVVWIPLFSFPLAITGFFDDRYDLPPSFRYTIQFLTVISLALISPLVKLPSDFLLFFLLLIGSTAVINFVNFTDGLDGLVAGCMLVIISASAIYSFLPLPIWSLVGALCGFLIVNWSPAKIFMGDVGSTFLGAVFVGLLLQAPTWNGSLALLLIATPLLGDACFCVLRRLISGQQIFQAHRLHLFQRLHQAGWSQSRVSSLYIVGTLLLAAALLWGGLLLLSTLAALELLIGVWLDQHIAVPFAVASKS